MDWDDEGEEVQSLYTHPADQVAEGVVVSRELLERLIDPYADCDTHRAIRALLTHSPQ